MHLFEKQVVIDALIGKEDLLHYIGDRVQESLGPDETPIRFVVTETSEDGHRCEIGVLAGCERAYPSIFEWRKRSYVDESRFNVAVVVPTGIGAEIGGHAGDAAPVVRLISEVADLVVTHPNVVNGSDINEMPHNTIYVEGSVLSRFILGSVALQPVRANRVLVVIDDHPDELFVNAAVNSVDAARASYGLICEKVLCLRPAARLAAEYAPSGRAAGRAEGFDELMARLLKSIDDYDVIAISTVIRVPYDYHMGYFESRGEMINPWGGVEAMLTHTLSGLLNKQSAHSPMFESRDIANMDPGIVDPRMAAEAVSLTFLQCTLKGLQASPRILPGTVPQGTGVLGPEHLHCVVIPDGCLGLPTIGALSQGIPVIAVKENRNSMRNNLEDLPWSTGQLMIVDNYWEAIGVMAAMKSGMSPGAVRRPLKNVEVWNNDDQGAKEYEPPSESVAS